MKKLALGILLVLAVVLVNAKEKETKIAHTENTATMILSGSIADENSGELLVGVEVKIEGTDLKTYTDFDGNFSFENVKPGDYKLVTNYISYKSNVETLSAGSNKNKVNLKLKPSN